MPSYLSCSRSPKVAIDFALSNPKADHLPILLVFTCQNYKSTEAIRLNNEAYTAYPYEAEILLEEGVETYVLAEEKNVLIDNPHPNFKKFNGKSMTIIHLFLP